MINVSQPSLGDEEINALKKVFESNWVGKGKYTSEFEAAFAAYQRSARNSFHATTSGTEALFQVVDILDLKSDDEVILPSISFVGAGNAIGKAGARPIFCDVDARTLNATADHIEAKITAKTRAVIVTHYGGLPADLDPILDLCRNHDVILIEDSACAVSSRYKGRACGTIGDLGIWSFDAVKILVTGDGGMIYSRSDDLSERVRTSLYFGHDENVGMSAINTKKRWWEFDVKRFGRRGISNDIVAAIGLEQLKKLPAFIDRRKVIHEFYNSELKSLAWVTCPPNPHDHFSSSYYFYWIEVAPGNRDELALFMKERGIFTSFRYYPLHRIKKYGASGSFPNSDHAAENVLCIPIHQGLSDNDVAQVVESIRLFGKKFI